MIAEFTFTPRAPYALARSARSFGDRTRRLRGGAVELVYSTAAGPVHARVVQRQDGDLRARLEAVDPVSAHDRLRALLAVGIDDELTAFYRRTRGDRLLERVVLDNRGLRPLPLGSVTHALVRAVTGQLIQAREARRIECAILDRIATPHAGLLLPPTRTQLGRLAPATLVGFGLAERRGLALLRAARTIDLDGLADRSTTEVRQRITAIAGLGPWTAGVVANDGLGRLDIGPVGDLALEKVVAGADISAGELLDRYAPYQALAALYLMRSPAAATAAPVAAIAAARRSARTLRTCGSSSSAVARPAMPQRRPPVPSGRASR